MEQYLEDQYQVIDMTEHLESHEDIKDWCEDLDDLEEELFMENGEVFSEEETVIIEIKDKFYKVTISCESELTRSDYWKGYKSVLISTSLVKYNEIPKPTEKLITLRTIQFSCDDETMKAVEAFFSLTCVDFEIIT
jgi:arsenate reductase-like glutaredoxin family protein